MRLRRWVARVPSPPPSPPSGGWFAVGRAPPPAPRCGRGRLAVGGRWRRWRQLWRGRLGWRGWSDDRGRAGRRGHRLPFRTVPVAATVGGRQPATATAAATAPPPPSPKPPPPTATATAPAATAPAATARFAPSPATATPSPPPPAAPSAGGRLVARAVTDDRSDAAGGRVQAFTGRRGRRRPVARLQPSAATAPPADGRV